MPHEGKPESGALCQAQRLLLLWQGNNLPRPRAASQRLKHMQALIGLGAFFMVMQPELSSWAVS